MDIIRGDTMRNYRETMDIIRGDTMRNLQRNNGHNKGGHYEEPTEKQWTVLYNKGAHYETSLQ